MKVEPIILIQSLHGKLNQKAEYYFRRAPSGEIFACKCPDRSAHKATPAQLACRQAFAAKYAGKNKKQ